MPDIVALILAGLSVGLGNFAASIAIGLSGLERATRVKIAVVFGIFETGMPLIGLALGNSIAAKLGGHANLIGGGLLILTGIHLTINAVRGIDDKDVKKAASANNLSLIMTAAALSIDNLIVGFSLGSHHESLIEAALIIGISSVALSMIGLELGSRLSSKVEKYSEVLSGLILIFVGLAIGLKWI